MRSRVSRELPLEIAELCIEPKVSQEQLVFAGELKARRCSSHRKALTSSSVTQELSHKKPRKEFLEDVFRRVELRAPRAGTVVVHEGEVIFEDAKKLCTNFQVRAVELCRGTDRFRLPKGEYEESDIPLRQTFILHRVSGEVEQLGDPEKWLELPKTKRASKAKPAKLSITVFGKPLGLSSDSRVQTSPEAGVCPSVSFDVPMSQKREGEPLPAFVPKRPCVGEPQTENPQPENPKENSGEISAGLWCLQ